MGATPLETAGVRAGNRQAPARGAADWLALATAPTFAFMALITAVSGGHANLLCGDMDGGSMLSGMVPMYALMSAFHLPPWLKLVSHEGRTCPS